MGPLGWLAMSVSWILLLGLIVWLVVRLLPGSARPTRQSDESALENFDRRLANGEIDPETWHSQRAALLAAQRGTT
jgi:putative membrane protein